MELNYKKAVLEDIEILTETRITVLRAANQLSDDVEMSDVKEQSYLYYQKALSDIAMWRTWSSMAMNLLAPVG